VSSSTTGLELHPWPAIRLARTVQNRQRQAALSLGIGPPVSGVGEQFARPSFWACLLTPGSPSCRFQQFDGRRGSSPSGMRRSGVLIRSSEVVTRRPQQHCSIALWRGYVSAQFYVHEPGNDDAPRFSPSFRTWHFPWEGSEPLEADIHARAALAALRDDLLGAGWTRMRRASGSEWYELRFRRDAAVRELQLDPTHYGT
jgi:hypothetical protein